MTRMTFGFQNLNGSAIQLKLLKTPTGRMPSERTIRGLRNYTVTIMNRHGRRAKKIAKTPGHAPWKKGHLNRSIKWQKAKKGSNAGRVVVGAITVGVPYGRIQEFEHKTRGQYLHRAIAKVWPDFLADLKKRGVLGDVLFARRRFR
tara:strand:+ start:2022 stop:2459 length:438 start_codon:yes stop_codon:yes gene_type:complete